MTILLIALLSEATGNRTTAERIRAHLEAGGHRVLPLPVEGAKAVADWPAFLKEEGVDGAIGIHAFGGGQFLRALRVPTAIVFGGTDLNENVRDPGKLPVMTDAVRNARALVVYNDDFRKKCEAAWPEHAGKVRVIPQSVRVFPSAFSLRKRLAMGPEETLFLLPSGLRPVKDPLFCAEAFSAWHRRNPSVRLVIAGAVRDAAYAAECKARLRNLPGVTAIDPLPQPDLHAAMREAAAVLNTSRSECSPNALLEAMAIGTPVLARDIPGNRAIVRDRETGLLFPTPDECVARAEELLRDASLRRSLAENAAAAVAEEHSWDAEGRAYRALVDSF